MKKMRKELGITLIALVVTIIILIIIASIAINMVLGENGLIRRAQNAQLQYNIGRITDMLEVQKASLAVENNYIISTDIYIEYIKGKNIIQDKDITDIGIEGKKYIIVENKYIFLIEDEENGNVKITYMGIPEDIDPVITKLDLTNTINTITAKVETKLARVEKYKYYIKENDEYVEKGNTNSNEFTYEDLEADKLYYIKVEAISISGKIATIYGEKRTGESQLVITYSQPLDKWTNLDIIANVTSKGENQTIKTSKDIENLETLQTQTFTENGTLYVELYEGENCIEKAKENIKNIDKIDPVITSAIAKENKIELKATDTISGIIEYAITTDDTQPTSFQTIENTKLLNVTINITENSTIYYAWVKDAAGNITRSDSIDMYLIDFAEVGDYVEYIPDYEETSIEAKQVGADSNQYLETDYPNWRVLSKNEEEGTIDLINITNDNSAKLTLNGVEGYNNSVKTLDDACHTLYNNSKFTENVKNLKIEDIQKVMDTNVWTWETYTNSYHTYNEIVTYKDGTYYYPTQWLNMRDNTIKGQTATGILGPSDKGDLVSGKGETTEITSKYTYWDVTTESKNFIKEIYYDILMKNEKDYWVSSRAELCGSKQINYGTRYVSNGSIDAYPLFITYFGVEKYENSNTYCLRPVITIKKGTIANPNNNATHTDESTPWKLICVE